jgi:hypothetical protein
MKREKNIEYMSYDQQESEALKECHEFWFLGSSLNTFSKDLFCFF